MSKNYDWLQCFYDAKFMTTTGVFPENTQNWFSQTIAMIFDDLNGVAKMADPKIRTPLGTERHRENEI